MKEPPRIKQFEEEGIEPQMPECDAAHLAAYLFDAGPMMAGGMGEVPLSSGELQAWQEQSGIELRPWEFRLLRRLSREYLAECHRAEKPDCPAPYMPEVFQPDRASVAKRMKAEMAKLVKL